MSQRSDVVIVTGGQGFIGAYVAKLLLEENERGAKNRVVVFDVKEDNNILSQVLSASQIAQLERVYGDIVDTDAVVKLVDNIRPTIIVHLAGLQVPTCRANPVLGAKVNVLGTINIFEAVKALKDKYKHVCHVSYASSAAVTGKAEDYVQGVVEDDTPNKPMTHYGVFKMANEGNARVYWADHQIPSVGLRPFTVYGVGREIGITSGPTKAVKALVLGRDYTIPFTGDVCVSFVEDVASYFVRVCRADLKDAYALNLRGDVLSVDQWIKLAHEAVHGSNKLTSSGAPLPFPVHFTEVGLEKLLGEKPVKTTPPAEGIKKTVAQFQKLKEQGTLHDRDLK